MTQNGVWEYLARTCYDLFGIQAAQTFLVESSPPSPPLYIIWCVRPSVCMSVTLISCTQTHFTNLVYSCGYFEQIRAISI